MRGVISVKMVVFARAWLHVFNYGGVTQPALTKLARGKFEF